MPTKSKEISIDTLKGKKKQNKFKGVKCKENHKAWVTTHTYEYYDKNQNEKTLKEGTKGK